MLNNSEQNTLDEAVLESLSWKKQARQAQKDIAALKLANSVILAELEAVKLQAASLDHSSKEWKEAYFELMKLVIDALPV